MKTQKRLNDNIIGPSKKYSTPITLDPAYYEGAIIYADGELYYSNGEVWQNPAIELPDNIWVGDIDLENDTNKSLRFQRKTTAETDSFTGEPGQVTVDTTKNTLVVHDGTTGGSTLVSELGSQSLSNKTLNLSDTTITGINGDGLNVSEGELNIDRTVVVTTDSNQTITGTKTFNSQILLNNANGIRTNQSSFNLIPQNAVNVNIANAATNISIASSEGETVINNSLVVEKDLIVNGDTVTTSTDILILEDKILSLLNLEESGDPEPTDGLADGGGIELNGTTVKEFKWFDSTEAWTSSENIDINSGKSYLINGESVLSENTLESAITDSSLTSVGTLTTGTWNATAISSLYGGTGQTSYIDGELLIGNSDGNTLGKARLTEGSGISISNGNASITVSNSDPGSAQNIFKNIADETGNTQFSTETNNDTIRFAGSGTASVAFSEETNTITINTPEATLAPAENGGINVVEGTISVDNTVVRTSGDQTIDGVKTFNSSIDGDINGNAGTATALETARTINGVSFDGTEDITVSTTTTESLTAGDGLTGGSFDGTTAVTFANGDKGSDQSIFKTIRDESDANQITANGNSDFIKFVGGTGTDITFNSSENTITIESTGEEVPEPDVFKNIGDSNGAVQFFAEGANDTLLFDGEGDTNVTFVQDTENNTKTVVISTDSSIDITDNNTTNSDLYPVFSNETVGNITGLNVNSQRLTFNPSTGTLAATNFNSLSDARYKTNINKIRNPLGTIEEIEGVSFNWKETGEQSIGFIAQEIEKVLPELVYSDDSGRKLLSYGNITALLLEAIKQQQVMINQLMNDRSDK